MRSNGLFKSGESNRLTGLVFGDIILIFFSAYIIKQYSDYSAPSFFAFSENLFFITVIFLSYLFDLYANNFGILKNKFKQVTSSLFAITLSILFLIGWNIWISRHDNIEYWIAIGIVFFIFQTLWHIYFYRVSNNSIFSNRVLVIGTQNKAISTKNIVDAIPHYHFDGFVSSPDEEQSNKTLITPVVCSIEKLERYVRLNNIDIIVNALSDRRGNLPIKQLLICKLLGIRIVDYATLYEEIFGKLPVEELSHSWLVYSHGFQISGQIKVLKRLADIILASIFIIATLPLQILVALAVKTTSPGPAIYSQIRVGEQQCSFRMYKFRSMCQDAEHDCGAVMSQQNDSRITPIGNILRKLRLDELPQLINILIGDMSFIGPRPERPEFVEKIKQITPFYPERHFIKPGLTGWAQIRYPYGDSLDDSVEKLRYDLYYINNISFGLDLYILFETIKVVLFGRGGR